MSPRTRWQWLSSYYDTGFLRVGLSEGQLMSILSKLLGRGGVEPAARVRVCIECGMPVEQHKDWCAILQTRLEMERKRPAPGPGPAPTPGLTD